MKIIGKSFDSTNQYAVFTAHGSASPASAQTTNYLYYLAESVVGTTVINVIQQGSSANNVPLSTMWLVVEAVGGEYKTLDGRRWNKVFTYDFNA